MHEQRNGQMMMTLITRRAKPRKKIRIKIEKLREAKPEARKRVRLVMAGQ